MGAMKFPVLPLVVFPIATLFLVGCVSLDKVALDAVGDSLSAEGSNIVFSGDNDPQLVADSLPFAIKMEESFSAANPGHAGLKRSVGMLCILYANAFVAGPADYLDSSRYEEKVAAKKRALNLYLRGREFVLQSLELRHPGFAKAWNDTTLGSFPTLLALLKKDDVSSLYWLSAGQLAAYALQPMNLSLGAKLGKTLLAVNRAYELNPDFQKSTLDELLLSIHASIPADLGGDASKVPLYFDRALRKNPTGTGAYLAWATGVDLPAQNRDHFVEMLNKVLAADPQADPNATLVTILNQKRAAWYLAQLDDLFL